MTLAAGERTQPSPAGCTLGHPRLHLRRLDSTNERAHDLAIAGAPDGALVTAAEQTAGRGRQGRRWVAPAGSALLCSLVLREPPPLLSLIAGVAVCDVVGERARVKWPNDIVVESRASAPQQTVMPTPAPLDNRSPEDLPRVPTLAKLAGILVEGRPQEGWAVLGIGVNVAVGLAQLPAEVRECAASLELAPSAIEPLLGRLLGALERRLAEPMESVLDAWRVRDALLGREVSWEGHRGTRPSARGNSPPNSLATSRHGGRHGHATGIDDNGRLIVTLADGATTTLDAGEVHLGRSG